MNEKSRSYNSKKNLINGLFNQALTIFLTFFCRTLFIKYLGIQYLGINGLYANILELLSLTELGLSNIALFRLYKPIADNDEKKINELVTFFTKVYNVIFLIVLLFGLLITPFLRFIIDSNLPLNELTIYYLMFLLNTCFSYLFISKRLLIIADQKIYIVKNATTVFLVIQNLLQMIIIYFYKNYYLYLIIQIVCTLLLNIFIGYKCKKNYIFLKTDKSLSNNEKKDIFLQTKDLFIYKISVVIINSTDNIFVSILLGTIFVGYYSNYSMIVTMISNILIVIVNSISSSIGNLNVKETNDKKVDLFYVLLFAMQWIVGICSTCLLLLFNDFITLWIGENYLFDIWTVIIIVLNFYVTNIISPIWIYREAMGLYNKVKNIILLTAFLNIVLSLILGYFFGLSGIFLATIISKMLTTIWYEPIILLKNSLKSSVKIYYIKQILFMMFFIISSYVVYEFTKNIVVNSLSLFIFKALIVLLLSNIIYLVLFFRKKEFKYIIKKILNK